MAEAPKVTESHTHPWQCYSEFLGLCLRDRKDLCGEGEKKKQENAANADAFVSHDWDSGLVSTHSKQRKQKCERLFGSNFLNVFWEARVGHWSFKFE